MREPSKPPFERIVFVCSNERPAGEDSCGGRGSAEFQKKLKEYAKSKGLAGRCRVSRALCLGLCSIGPNVCVMPENVWYHGVTEADLEEIRRKWIDPLAK
jgi:(2Fe-2S) ferredoxin